MKTESLKTIVLAVLFVTCLILTNKVLGGLNVFGDLKTTPITKASSSTHIEDVLCPQSYAISFGGGLHTGVYETGLQEQLWTITKGILKQSLNGSTLNPIEDREWTTALNNRGVSLYMPFGYTKDVFSALIKAPYEGVDLNINVILINSETSPSIYFGNTFSRKYYRVESSKLTLDEVVRGSQVIQEMINEQEKMGYAEFKTIESIYSIQKVIGTQSTNNTLMSVIPINTLNPYVIGSRMATESLTVSEMQSLAASAFGSDLSFVKKIEDSDGSIIYLYGYGEKSLKVSVDGKIEYNQIKPSLKKQITFEEGLSLSVAFIERYGKEEHSFVLDRYEIEEESDGIIQRFNFVYTINGLPLHMNLEESVSPLTVEIENGAITKFYKTEIFKKSELTDHLNPSKAIEEILDLNYNIFSADYPTTKAKEKDRTYSYQLLNQLSQIQAIYYLKSEGDVSIAYPAWRVQMGKWVYIFDWYNGTLLERTNLAKEGK